MKTKLNKNFFFRRISTLILVAVVLITTCGCNIQDSVESTIPISSNPFSDDIVNGEDVQFAYGFGLLTPDSKSDFVYEGDALSAEYFIDNVGVTMSTGMLMFVNGIPQKYSVNNGEETYMHIQEAPANQTTIVKISFVPVCGKAGDKLSVRFLSILNPQIRPTKLEYMYGHTNAMTTFFPRYIEMKQDAPTQTTDYAHLAPQRDMTKEEIDQVIYIDRKGNEINRLRGFNLIVRNYQHHDQAYLTVKDQKFTFELQGYGGVATEYIVIPFINQIPFVSKDFPSIMTVDDGTKIYEGTFTVDISKLDQISYCIEEFNTFYLLAIPIDGSSLLDPVISESYVFSGK